MKIKIIDCFRLFFFFLFWEKIILGWVLRVWDTYQTKLQIKMKTEVWLLHTGSWVGCWKIKNSPVMGWYYGSSSQNALLSWSDLDRSWISLCPSKLLVSEWNNFKNWSGVSGQDQSQKQEPKSSTKGMSYISPLYEP